MKIITEALQIVRANLQTITFWEEAFECLWSYRAFCFSTVCNVYLYLLGFSSVSWSNLKDTIHFEDG